MLGNEGMIQRGRGLVDLIAGVTPTFVDWTNDPTDAADITDDDPATFCTTGDKVAGSAWQPCYFEWDLGGFYSVLAGMVGHCSATAGTPAMFVGFWDGAAWVQSRSDIGGSVRAASTHAAVCSKVHVELMSSAAATITPNIREFHVWRL